MALRVAACPKCRGPIVYGERACRQCGQAFQYGAAPPPEPSFAQIVEALAAVGLPAPQPRSSPSNPNPPMARPPMSSPSNPMARPPMSSPSNPMARPPMSSPSNPASSSRPQPRPPEAAAPLMEGLDSGRFGAVGDVELDDVPGLMDSGNFRIFTPKEVTTQPVAGFDDGRFADGAALPAAPPPGLEAASWEKAPADVLVPEVSGIFRSDIYAGAGEVNPTPVDGLEASSTRPSPKHVKDDDLSRITCRCGEIHKRPRCPSCGTVHRERAT